MQLTLALLQMNTGADMAANIAAFEVMVAQAAAQGAQLVASPENTFLMGSESHAAMSAAPRYTQETHPGLQAASACAQKHGLWLLVGSVAVQDGIQDSGKSYNRSVLFAPNGTVVAAYDKIHLFDVEVGDGQTYRESAKMRHGERAVVTEVDDGWRMTNGEEIEERVLSSVIRQPSAVLGLSICYDLRFPQLYRALAKAGAQVLAVPSAFTQTTGEAHWHVLLRARAIENGCFVIAPAQCGTHPGNRQTYGHSLVVDPWGRVLADGGREPGVVMTSIDLGEVARVRAKLPSLSHDRDILLQT
jgi:predicted amidohydrolase